MFSMDFFNRNYNNFFIHFNYHPRKRQIFGWYTYIQTLALDLKVLLNGELELNFAMKLWLSQ